MPEGLGIYEGSRFREDLRPPMRAPAQDGFFPQPIIPPSRMYLPFDQDAFSGAVIRTMGLPWVVSQLAQQINQSGGGSGGQGGGVAGGQAGAMNQYFFGDGPAEPGEFPVDFARAGTPFSSRVSWPPNQAGQAPFGFGHVHGGPPFALGMPGTPIGAISAAVAAASDEWWRRFMVMGA